MTDQETLPADVHPEAALLPWYATGTLGDAERRQVAQHLETCAACRTALEELTALRTELTAIYATQPGPSEQAARSVLGAVARDASVRKKSQLRQEIGLDRIDQWLRSFFMPRWVPTLAAVLLITQVGLLLWVTMPAEDKGKISSRSLEMQTAKIRMVFQISATEAQIRSLLQDIHARMIDGPTVDGRYTIEVPAGDESAIQKKLQILRGRTDIVLSAEAVNR